MEFFKNRSELQPDFNINKYLESPHTYAVRNKVADFLESNCEKNRLYSEKYLKYTLKWNKIIAPKLHEHALEAVQAYHRQLVDLDQADVLLYPEIKIRARDDCLETAYIDLASIVQSTSLLTYDSLSQLEQGVRIPNVISNQKILEDLNTLITQSCTEIVTQKSLHMIAPALPCPLRDMTPRNLLKVTTSSFNLKLRKQ